MRKLKRKLYVLERKMQGYKVNISTYEYFTGEIVDGKRSTAKEEMKFTIGHLLCVPQLGGDNGKPPEGFDLGEYYRLARKIEKEETDYITFDSKDYEVLKKRMKQIATQAGYRYGEMVLRVLEAEEIKLGEVKE